MLPWYVMVAAVVLNGQEQAGGKVPVGALSTAGVLCGLWRGSM
jgi:hypothetical protein